jgi:hypothetical protein
MGYVLAKKIIAGMWELHINKNYWELHIRDWQYFSG